MPFQWNGSVPRCWSCALKVRRWNPRPLVAAWRTNCVLDLSPDRVQLQLLVSSSSPHHHRLHRWLFAFCSPRPIQSPSQRRLVTDRPFLSSFLHCASPRNKGPCFQTPFSTILSLPGGFEGGAFSSLHSHQPLFPAATSRTTRHPCPPSIPNFGLPWPYSWLCWPCLHRHEKPQCRPVVGSVGVLNTALPSKATRRVSSFTVDCCNLG